MILPKWFGIEVERCCGQPMKKSSAKSPSDHEGHLDWPCDCFNRAIVSAVPTGDNEITSEHLLRACDLEQIDALGLGPTEQKYLSLLAEGSTRLNVLASVLGLPSRTVAEVTEPFLDSCRACSPRTIKAVAN